MEGSGGRRFRLFFLPAQLHQFVQCFHQPEYHQGQNQKIDDGGDKVAVIQGVYHRRAGFIHGPPKPLGQGKLPVRKIHAAQEHGGNGHNHIIGQGFGDGGKAAADDDAHRQRQGVAFYGKGFKLCNPAGLFPFLSIHEKTFFPSLMGALNVLFIPQVVKQLGVPGHGAALEQIVCQFANDFPEFQWL